MSIRGIPRPVVVSAALLLAAGVCLSQVQGPSDSAATLIQMAGQVSVLRGNATYALNLGETVLPQQLIITGPDGSAIFKVADGSTFEVFPNSKAVFRETMGDWTDLLRMLLGRVRVQIQHLGGVPNPNKVRTPTAVISVRGTIFDVTVEDQDGTTLVLVEEGKVQVRHLLQPGPPKSLERGEWVEIHPDEPLAAQKPDHGLLYRQLYRAFNDAMYQILLNGRAGTGPAGLPGGTSAGGGSSDKNGSGGSTGGGSTGGGSGAPPAPPPPPPPPPRALA